MEEVEAPGEGRAGSGPEGPCVDAVTNTERQQATVQALVQTGILLF